jgi:hypothetical protein
MADIDKNIRITTSRNKTTPPKIVFTGSSAGSSVITLEVLDDNTLSFTSNEGQIFSLDSNLSTGTIWSVNDISGYPLLRADVGAAAGATIRIAEGLGNVGIGETNPIHKFNVKGALAIGSTNTANYTVFRFPAAGSGQTYILPSAYPGTGTSILQSDTTGNLLWVAAASGGGSGTTSANVNVTLATTAAVHRVLFTPATTTVAGAAISENTVLSYNPSTDILTTSGLAVTATTASTSSTTGALTVSGGVGIGGSLNVGIAVTTFGVPRKASFVGSNNDSSTVVIQNTSTSDSMYAAIYFLDYSGSSGFIRKNSTNNSSFAGSMNLYNVGDIVIQAATGYTVNIYSQVKVIPGTVSISTTSGALIVSGGVGIGGSIFGGSTISAADNIEIKSAKELRLNNSGNTFFTGVKAGANAANYTLTLPTAVPGAGTSILVSDSTGAMAFVPLIGLGVSSFASNNAVSITHLEPFMVTFCSGYTPVATGADSVVFRFPENVVDGSSSIVYSLRRVQMRVETLSAGTSTIRLEKYGWAAGVGTGAFSTVSTGSTANVMLVPLNIGGVGMGETFVTSASIGFSTGGTSFVSGDKLRVNFTTLNATHANFTITAIVDTIS